MSEIKKIVLSVGDKEIELTPDEAKELRKILGDLFGEKETTVIPVPYPVQPYYPWTIWGTGTLTACAGFSTADMSRVK